jgi:hypothetical protein
MPASRPCAVLGRADTKLDKLRAILALSPQMAFQYLVRGLSFL